MGYFIDDKSAYLLFCLRISVRRVSVYQTLTQLGTDNTEVSGTRMNHNGRTEVVNPSSIEDSNTHTTTVPNHKKKKKGKGPQTIVLLKVLRYRTRTRETPQLT